VLETIILILQKCCNVGSLLTSPSSTHLMVLMNHQNGLLLDTVRVYVLPTEDSIALAKSRLKRLLTKAECQQYLHVDKCP
jgi:hypothetical protein